MSIFILYNWQIMNNEIWPRLEESENAIDDLYCVLLNTYLEKQKDAFFKEVGTKEEIQEKTDYYWDLVGAANDIERAKNEFYEVPPPSTEVEVITIVEGYYDSLLEYNDILAEEYKSYLKNFLLKYNVRYRICDPCKLTLTLEGLLSTQLDYIKYLASFSGRSKIDSIKILENHLRQIESPFEEHNCINNSIKLIEHFLYDITQKNTLGQALDHSKTLFPSESARNSLKDYYEFANSYPNIRHIGLEKNAKRDLNKSDGILAISLAIAYSAFITQNYDAILYGKYIKLSEVTQNDLFSSLF